MAAKFGIIQSGVVTLVTATAKSVLQLAVPASLRVRVLGWGIMFDGTSVTNQPVSVGINISSTAGTFTSVTPRQIQPVAEALQCTAGSNASAEPTVSYTFKNIYVHPQAGFMERFPMGQEIIVAASTWFNVKANAPNGVDAVAWVEFEE